jgi:hypothetical protein
LLIDKKQRRNIKGVVGGPAEETTVDFWVTIIVDSWIIINPYGDSGAVLGTIAKSLDLLAKLVWET